MTISVVTSVSTVGSKKLPPWAARLLPVTTLAPFLTESAMCASTFSTALMSINGPITAPGSKPAATFIARGLGEALGEGVIDAVLHQDAVGTHIGLDGMPIFPGDGALDHRSISALSRPRTSISASFKRDFSKAPAGRRVLRLPVEF